MTTKEVFLAYLADKSKEELVEIIVEAYEELIEYDNEVPSVLDIYFILGIKQAYKKGKMSLEDALKEYKSSFGYNDYAKEFVIKMLLKHSKLDFNDETLKVLLNS